MTGGAQRCSASLKRLGLVAAFCIAWLISARAIFAQTFKVDGPRSQSLTTYLRQHRLPLVGAQLLRDSAGNQRIVLYGFVATEFGKNDAPRQALAYIENGAPAGTSAATVENRIEIRPEIARMKTNTAPATAADASSKSLDQVLDEIDRYGITLAPAPIPK
jgi:hypothetical protein